MVFDNRFKDFYTIVHHILLFRKHYNIMQSIYRPERKGGKGRKKTIKEKRDMQEFTERIIKYDSKVYKL